MYCAKTRKYKKHTTMQFLQKKNVYLISGKELTKLCKDSGTVDGCHPTDFGFASVAEALSVVIERIDIQ